MANFCEIDENNIVLRCLVIPDEEEHRGEEYLNVDCNISGRFLKASYNTRAGIYYLPNSNEPHPDQSKAFRKNMPGPGWFYDEEQDAFIPPKPFPSWVFDDETFQWLAPVAYPDDIENIYIWDEESQI